jgi:hypothetical protein
MKKNIISIILLVTSYVAIGQSQKIEILFADNGIEKKLNNYFNIYFVYQDSIQKVIYKPIVFDGKYIRVPSKMPINEELKYYILFEYKGKIYYCDYSKYLYFYTSDAFLIHIKKRPFDRDMQWGKYYYNIVPSLDISDTDKSKIGEVEIVYGKGDCAATYTKITNFKEYFKKGKDLLKW